MCEFLFVITCHVYFQGANYNPFALLENNFPVTQGNGIFKKEMNMATK